MKFNKNALLLVIVVATFLGLLFIINQEEFIAAQLTQPGVTPDSDKVAPDKSQPASNLTLFVNKDICEGCHMSGKPFIPQALSVKPHINGGAYCLICHKISHETHPINQNVTCEKCHGRTSPTKPAFINGSIVCNNCHNYPDPLQPSNGNLITIHRPREITCNTCHTDECTKCHSETGTSARWEKRLEHFRALNKQP